MPVSKWKHIPVYRCLCGYEYPAGIEPERVGGLLMLKRGQGHAGCNVLVVTFDHYQRVMRKPEPGPGDTGGGE